MATPAFEEIVEDFEFLEDWEDRYRYVIEQGKDMDALDDALKVPARSTGVPVRFGCMRRSRMAESILTAIATP